MESSNISIPIHLSCFLDVYGLPPDFFEKLEEDDDWSFIIKIHAIFEALLSDLIRWELSRDELADFISRLDISGKPIGKLELAKILNLIEKDESAYIRALSKLRNELVHNIRNVDLTLPNYVSSLTKEQVSALCFGLKETHTLEGKKLSKIGYFKNNIRDCVYGSSILLLCGLQERRISKNPKKLLDETKK